MSTGIEKCKQIIAEFNAKKIAERGENKKPRIDVLSKQDLQRLVKQNFKIKLANLPKKDRKDISEENIKEIANTLYEQLDKLTDKILR